MQITNSWITGFVDGDGCFNIQKVVTKENKVKIRHRFIVSQDKRSVEVLYALKKRLKCGTVHKAGNNMMAFTVTKREHRKDYNSLFHQKSLANGKKKRFL